MATANEPAELDNPQRSVWARWAKHEDWADALQRKATYKALDIPDDDMQIVNASKTQTGAGGGAIAAAALAGGIPATVLAAALGLSSLKGTPSPPAANPPAVSVPDTSYDVLFYDKDGNEITVPRYSPPKQ